jgi:hypothetical protein
MTAESRAFLSEHIFIEKCIRAVRGPLGCEAMWSCRWLPTFRRNVFFPSSRMKWWEYELYHFIGLGESPKPGDWPFRAKGWGDDKEMESLCFSETLVSAYKCTGHYNTEYRHRRFSALRASNLWEWSGLKRERFWYSAKSAVNVFNNWQVRYQ